MKVVIHLGPRVTQTLQRNWKTFADQIISNLLIKKSNMQQLCQPSNKLSERGKSNLNNRERVSLLYLERELVPLQGGQIAKCSANYSTLMILGTTSKPLEVEHSIGMV